MTLLQAASPIDCEAIARVWHAAWHDAHADIVPARLLPHRGLGHFRTLAAAQAGNITVAVQADTVVGFVGVDEDELELLFVAAAARGTGVADALIAHAQRHISERWTRAYLLVVEANARARRFYERHGYCDTGPFAYEAVVPGGKVSVPHRRYEKQLR
jgi:ribosomal protein S18 acetylase RimI-like enzyme